MKMLDIWKWRIPSFPRGWWISFPSHPPEIREVQENGHFQIFQAYFHGHRGRPKEAPAASKPRSGE